MNQSEEKLAHKKEWVVNEIANHEIAKGTYSNLAVIRHTQEEFMIDFYMRTPEETTILVARVIMSPDHMERFKKAIADNLDKFKQKKASKKIKKSS